MGAYPPFTFFPELNTLFGWDACDITEKPPPPPV